MKKVIILLLLATASLSAISQVVKGDTNDDRAIDVSDVNSAINIALGEQPTQYVKWLDNVVDTIVIKGDMNDDGIIDVADINGMVNTILGLSPVSYIWQKHQYVDLGLPSGTLWATCNIGAADSTQTGLYFAWGETKGHPIRDGRLFDFQSYKYFTTGEWSGPAYDYYTKYTFADGRKSALWYEDGIYVGTTVDGVTYKSLKELLPEDDAAIANWGSDWVMPTQKQLRELWSYCKVEYEYVSGWRITGPNGNVLYLPVTGYRIANAALYYTDEGYYWGKSLGALSSGAVSFYFSAWNNGDVTSEDRRIGLAIRPVRATSK